VVDPSNLANTSLGLAGHTDNPYRDPVPTMQLLHCLESTAEGGENFLIDGWRVANEVRQLDPAGFDLLVHRAVTFLYRDGATELSAHVPLIELDSDGMVRSVRFNPRSMQQPSMPSAELAAWYDAYLPFARLLADLQFQIRFRLDPGDLFIVDNRRVLHGRTAYEATSGSRHLQGCYADIDGLHSTISVLQRQDPS
jgi:gamma-butyrobetaine dioxygenase